MFMLECKSTLSVNTSLLLQVSCFMYDFRICTLKPQKGMVHTDMFALVGIFAFAEVILSYVHIGL